jgi:hypothetical protein
LGEIGLHTDRVTAWRTARASDREPADLLGGGDVAIEQGRRQIADSHVVEAVARLVSREQRRDIHIQSQQIPDSVVVFRSRQPPDGRRPSGVRIGLGSAIERLDEIRDRRLVGRVVRTRPSDGRHLPRAKLAHDFLPDVRVPSDVVAGAHLERQLALLLSLDIAAGDRLERELAFLAILVVARKTILVDEREVRGRGRGPWRARLHEHAGRGCQQTHRCQCGGNRDGVTSPHIQKGYAPGRGESSHLAGQRACRARSLPSARTPRRQLSRQLQLFSSSCWRQQNRWRVVPTSWEE